jgi:PAS domain S-box-containing protein
MIGLVVAVVAVSAAVVLRSAAEPLLGDRAPFIFLFPAVLFAAWFGGRPPALLAIVLGAISTRWLFPAQHDESMTAYAGGIIVFAMVSISLIEVTMATRRAETRGARAAERLELTLEAGKLGLWERDLVTDEVWWSESLERVHGLPRGAFGRTFQAFRLLIHEDDRARVDAASARAVATLGDFLVDYRFLRPDGSVHWMTTSGRVFADAAGKPTRMVGTALDITEQRRAAGALHEIETRFEAVTTHAPLVVFAKDREGRYLMVNAMFAELANRPVSELVGKTDAELFAPEVASSFEYKDREVLESGEPQQFEETVHFGASELTFLTIKFALRDLDGAPVAVCGIANDITARKRAEAALQDADRRKDEFLAVLAHELRNPLAPIRLALEMLRTDPDHQAATRAMDVMGRQLGHLVRLIDDLLDVSRITRGRLELRRGHVTLGDVVRMAIETARPPIDAAGHTLEVAIEDDSIPLHADLTRLAQVVSNLLTNAAKYTPRGGKISVRSARDGEQVVISVTDTGVGLAAEHLRTVFEMFTQVGPVTRSQNGLGIGLALAEALVTKHGGTIDAASPGPGQGSTFRVRLPISARPEVAEPLRAPLAPSNRGLHVLVADDNLDAAETLAVFLETMGYVVHRANDGAEALQLATELAPDIAVLDIGMPHLDGYEVAKRLRAAGSVAVLIALTGWGQSEDLRRSREAGFDYHLVKPVQPSTLVTLLGSAVPSASRSVPEPDPARG